MVRIAVLDDWQGIAEAAADWGAVRAKGAEVVIFGDHLGGPEAVVAARFKWSSRSAGWRSARSSAPTAG